MEKVTHELKQLRKLAALLQSVWYYGEWKAETVNEREMEKIMGERGYWPVKISTAQEELNLKLSLPHIGETMVGERNNNNPGELNMTVLRKYIIKYLDDVESYDSEDRVHEATDVLFDFLQYIHASKEK